MDQTFDQKVFNKTADLETDGIFYLGLSYIYYIFMFCLHLPKNYFTNVYLSMNTFN